MSTEVDEIVRKMKGIIDYANKAKSMKDSRATKATIRSGGYINIRGKSYNPRYATDIKPQVGEKVYVQIDKNGKAIIVGGAPS